MSADYERLKLLFGRAGSLPELPKNMQRLIAMIDSGDASAIDLEKIISADPALSVAILRIANGQLHIDDHVATIRSAVLIVGQNAVRSLATSLMMQGMLQSRVVASSFSPQRYASHCLVTAYTARYIFARRQMKGQFSTRWSADEVFAAALLHDLGIALVACVAPEVFQRIYCAADRFRLTIAEAFEKSFGRDANELAAHAIEAWSLPKMFADTLKHQREPWGHLEEFTAISCINYADYLSCVYGCTLEKWEVEPKLQWEVENEVGLMDDEAARMLHLVGEQALACGDAWCARAA